MKWIAVTSIGFFSLLIGSFLAMLSYRLPLILKHCGHRKKYSSENTFNLFFPPSHCPLCKHTLSIFERVPIFAFFYLKGKCSYCGKKIHPRYLWIEIITLLCSCVIVYRFADMQLLSALILTWGLIVISGIDLEHTILPDVLVLPLLWLGLFFNAFNVFVSSKLAILGSSIAYISLWIFAKSYSLLTNKEGMGFGDFKCFAMLGAWLGLNALLDILLLASLLGSISGSILLLKRKKGFKQAIPFGPYLSIAGWIVLLLKEKPLFY